MPSLRTSADKGTPREETAERKQTYGENRYPRNPVRGFVPFVWEAFRNRTLIIMLVCAALSFALGIKMDGIKEGWYRGTSIAVEVCMVILVTAMSNYKLQGLQFEALIDYEKNIQVKVIRGGRHMCVSKYELVVGDIVYFNTGDCIPANGILVDGHSIKIDSSTIGRKAELSQVNAEHPILQSGCKVVNGYGTMVVTGVGMHSEWGKLMTSTSEDNKTETPLQVHLNGVNTLITKINNLIACPLFIILVVFYFIGHSTPLQGLPLPKFKRGATSVWEAIDAVMNIFIIAVTIMVVDAPEGLLFAVTLMRTYSMRKMMADKALVCRPAACETMAFATTICVNMTGTLTVNKMMNIEKAAWIGGSVREGIEGLDANIENLLHAEGIRHNNHGNVFISESNINEMKVSIKDPCWPGVLDAVHLCQGAGVRVCMLTEDNLLTAKAIATECGILREGDLAVDGSTLLNYDNYERKKKLPLISVMARCLPSDKVMMVKMLQDMGEVVMFTGDGANDVPSFRQADISLSMGIQGTNVAKESSDIIILNDDFHSIVKAICWGRFVYVNIQKFIELKLTVNMATFVINIVSMMTSGAVLLTTVQLLWVNLIMDFMLGVFALGEEPPTDELMKRGPIKRSKPHITCVMWCNLLSQSLSQVIIMLTFHFKAEDIFKLRSKPDAYAIKSTIIFNTFMLGQVFNEAFMLCQVFDKFKIFRGMSRNQMFVSIIATILIMQVAIVQFLPPKFASTHNLSWDLWLSCIGIGFLSSLVAFLLRLIPLPFDKDDAYCGYGNKKKRALEKRAHINKNANNNNSDEARVDITDHN